MKPVQQVFQPEDSNRVVLCAHPRRRRKGNRPAGWAAYPGIEATRTGDAWAFQRLTPAQRVAPDEVREHWMRRWHRPGDGDGERRLATTSLLGKTK